MHAIRILQLGDVHYPDGGRVLDYQDDGFPRNLASRASADTIQGSLRRVTALLEDDSRIHAILLTGDLTSAGRLDKYSEFVELLSGVLRERVPRIWNQHALIAVPGNHDIDRTLCGSDQEDHTAKFQPLAETWQAAGMPIIAIEDMRRLSLESGLTAGGSIEVFALNSCHGCGEKRMLPTAVREQLHDLLTEEAAQGTRESFDLVGEQLDTPAFLIDDVEALTDSLSDLDSLALPIVVSHHNLLPQTGLTP